MNRTDQKDPRAKQNARSYYFYSIIKERQRRTLLRSLRCDAWFFGHPRHYIWGLSNAPCAWHSALWITCGKKEPKIYLNLAFSATRYQRAH